MYRHDTGGEGECYYTYLQTPKHGSNTSGRHLQTSLYCQPKSLQLQYITSHWHQPNWQLSSTPVILEVSFSVIRDCRPDCQVAGQSLFYWKTLPIHRTSKHYWTTEWLWPSDVHWLQRPQFYRHPKLLPTYIHGGSHWQASWFQSIDQTWPSKWLAPIKPTPRWQAQRYGYYSRRQMVLDVNSV
jgi:hypothetical protein